MAVLGNRKRRRCNVEESTRKEKKKKGRGERPVNKRRDGETATRRNGDAAKRRKGESLGGPRTPGGRKMGLDGEGEKAGKALQPSKGHSALVAMPSLSRQRGRAVCCYLGYSRRVSDEIRN